VRGKLPGYQLAVEFRNKLWMESVRDQLLMNNCYADDAVVSARQLTALLRGRHPAVRVCAAGSVSYDRGYSSDWT
jgi:hypothetical protein